jgi:large repetitive protein
MPTDIVFATDAFPVAIVNMYYEVALAYSGDASPITHSAVVSGSLPPGLVLDSAIPWTRITGTPTSNGLYTFTISLTDTAGTVTSPALTIRCLTSGIDDWLYRPAKANIDIAWPGTE